MGTVEEEIGKEVIQKNTLAILVDAALAIEKVRVRSQVRQSHLKINNCSDPETDNLVKELQELEAYVDGRVARYITSHPAYDWFSKVKGIGKENIGKVLWQIDIQKASTISAVWRFSGYGVVNGKSEKRIKGKGKTHYNSQLRSMCWRLGGSLLKAKGKFYEYYIEQKQRYYEVYSTKGIAVVPATSLPKKDGKTYETEDMISEGHVHNQALRKMIKLFLACLWLVWRQAEGLPVTKPYAIEKLKHVSFIEPWGMVDK